MFEVLDVLFGYCIKTAKIKKLFHQKPVSISRSGFSKNLDPAEFIESGSKTLLLSKAEVYGKMLYAYIYTTVLDPYADFPKSLDPDPNSVIPDPKHCFFLQLRCMEKC
jgi:hypothetical protein